MGQRLLRFDGKLFAQMLSGEHHYRVVSDPLPLDVRIMDVRMKFRTAEGARSVQFLIESEEWAPIPEGQRIPEITPVLSRLDG